MNLHTLPTGSVISWTQHQGYVYTAVKARGGSWYGSGRYLTTAELEHQIDHWGQWVRVPHATGTSSSGTA